MALIPDLDQIEALAIERDSLWTRLESATFLTPNEKRAAAGYGPAPPTTKSRKATQKEFDPDQSRDEFGRWTTGDGGSESGISGSQDLNDTTDDGQSEPNLQLVQSGDEPPLKRLHPDATYERDQLAKSSLEYWRKQSTDKIVESLRPEKADGLSAKPDGTVMQGNTRLKALQERGYDVESLPRGKYSVGGSPYSNPTMRGPSGPTRRRPDKS